MQEFARLLDLALLPQDLSGARAGRQVLIAGRDLAVVNQRSIGLGLLFVELPKEEMHRALVGELGLQQALQLLPTGRHITLLQRQHRDRVDYLGACPALPEQTVEMAARLAVALFGNQQAGQHQAGILRAG